MWRWNDRHSLGQYKTHTKHKKQTPHKEYSFTPGPLSQGAHSLLEHPFTHHCHFSLVSEQSCKCQSCGEATQDEIRLALTKTIEHLFSYAMVSQLFHHTYIEPNKGQYFSTLRHVNAILVCACAQCLWPNVVQFFQKLGWDTHHLQHKLFSFPYKYKKPWIMLLL